MHVSVTPQKNPSPPFEESLKFLRKFLKNYFFNPFYKAKTHQPIIPKSDFIRQGLSLDNIKSQTKLPVQVYMFDV